MSDFNPDMLRLARLCTFDMKQETLAKAVGVSQGKVSKWEDGLLIPNDDDLGKLATHLKFPRDFFFHPGELYGFGASFLFHRRRQSVSARVLHTIHARMNVIGIGIQQLLSFPNLSHRHSLSIPRYAVNTSHSPEEIARKVRTDWGLPSGPIPNLMSVAESAGAIIVPMEFTSDKSAAQIDAISVRPAGAPPLIFTSIHAPADRQRYTLAHELGHLVMHDSDTTTSEDEADRFASELLMPSRDIRADLAGMSLQKAERLKLKWRTSMASVIKKAKDTKVISDYRARQLFIEMAPYRKREPVWIEPDVPRTLEKLVDAHLKKLKHSKQKLATIAFCAEVAQFENRFMRHKQPRLRVVG